MNRGLLVGLIIAFFGLTAACAGEDAMTDADRVCEFNADLAALNERTLPGRDEQAFPDSDLLQENFDEGSILLWRMVETAPPEIRDALERHAKASDELSEVYARFGYDHDAVTEEAFVDWMENRAAPDEDEQLIAAWFTEHCGSVLGG